MRQEEGQCTSASIQERIWHENLVTIAGVKRRWETAGAKERRPTSSGCCSPFFLGLNLLESATSDLQAPASEPTQTNHNRPLVIARSCHVLRLMIGCELQSEQITHAKSYNRSLKLQKRANSPSCEFEIIERFDADSADLCTPCSREHEYLHIDKMQCRMEADIVQGPNTVQLQKLWSTRLTACRNQLQIQIVTHCCYQIDEQSTPPGPDDFRKSFRPARMTGRSTTHTIPITAKIVILIQICNVCQSKFGTFWHETCQLATGSNKATIDNKGARRCITTETRENAQLQLR